MQTRDTVEGLHNFPEFSQPLSCLDEAMEKKRPHYCFTRYSQNYARIENIITMFTYSDLNTPINQ